MDWVLVSNQIVSVLVGLLVGIHQPRTVVIKTDAIPEINEVQVCLNTGGLVAVLNASESIKLASASPAITLSPTPTSCPQPSATATITQPKSISGSLDEALNNYRKEKGISAIQIDNQLCEATKKRWEQIGSDFSHAGFEVAVQGLGFTATAENIWRGSQPSPENVIKSWADSQGHKKNMEGTWQYGCGILNEGRAIYLFMNR